MKLTYCQTVPATQTIIVDITEVRPLTVMIFREDVNGFIEV